jgi:hypothetical protein
MLPGDDQLVAYGEDSTLSISRSIDATSTVKTSTLYWRSPPTGHQRRQLAGARQTHLETKATTYTLKNNATVEADAGGAPSAGSLTPLYVDHNADSRYGGYVIRTQERAIKSTSSGAFTRYRFMLAPQEEVTFVVEEDAQHYTTHTMPEKIRAVLSAERDAAVLSDADRKTLEEFVARAERRSRLQSIESTLRDLSRSGRSAIPERVRHEWRTSGALPKALLNALDALHAIVAKRAEGERQKGILQSRIEEVFTNQDRLRENIRSFEKIGSNELLTRYLSDMGREEDELIATRAKIAKLDEADSRLKEELGASELALSADVQRLREELDRPLEEDGAAVEAGRRARGGSSASR